MALNIPGYMSFMILLSIFLSSILISFNKLFRSFRTRSKFYTNFSRESSGTSNGINRKKNTRITKCSSSKFNESCHSRQYLDCLFFCRMFKDYFKSCISNKISSPYIRRRLLSIIQFLIISALITFTMFLLVVIPILFTKIPTILETIEKYKIILNFIRYSLILILLFLGASSLYYILPNVKLNFIDVFPGALLTVILWVTSGYLLSTYIVYYNQLNLMYGSLGSIIVTLIFFYIINMIFIYGAEFNYLMKNYENIE